MKKYFLFYVCSFFLAGVVKAQISGTVKNTNGQPIANALVCDANNVQNFTKTNSSGSYTLRSGMPNTQLRIAALKYQTIKTTSQRDIVLAEDSLLESDVYHISFDHLREGGTYTNSELKDDFPTAKGIGFYDGELNNGVKDETKNRVSVDYTNSIDPGGVSLKVKYPKGLIKTANSGIDTRIPLMNTFKDNYYEASDLYLSYWIRFSDDFDFNLCGGKLPSLGGSNPNYEGGPRDDQRWKGRIMFRKGGSIQFYMELPGDQEPVGPSANMDENELRFWGPRVVEGSNICTFEYDNYLREKGWHNIELHYVLESTPNGNDGLFEGWVDGVNYDFVGSDYFNYYRNSAENRENITINHILLSTFLGGSSDNYRPSKDYYVWFDEFRVSENRINEWGSYMNPSNTNIPVVEVESPINESPSVNITSPVNNQLFTIGETINFAATASDDSEVTKVNFKINDAFYKQDATAPYNRTFTPTRAGTYKIAAKAFDNEGRNTEDFVSITVLEDEVEVEEQSNTNSDLPCSFGAPLVSALPSFNRASFSNVYVLGNNSPKVSNIRRFRINWNASRNGLYQFAVNTDDGIPSNYVNLLGKMNFNFNSSNPELTLTNSGLPGWDGDYWVTIDNDNFVMVSKNQGHTIYFTNESAPNTNCESQSAKNLFAGATIGQVTLYPNPVKKILHIKGLDVRETLLQIVTLEGYTIWSDDNVSVSEINVDYLKSGMYFLIIKNGSNKQSIPFVKE